MAFFSSITKNLLLIFSPGIYHSYFWQTDRNTLPIKYCNHKTNQIPATVESHIHVIQHVPTHVTLAVAFNPVGTGDSLPVVKWLEHEADCSCPSSANCPYVFMTWYLNKGYVFRVWYLVKHGDNFIFTFKYQDVSWEMFYLFYLLPYIFCTR
jgi:hypothetical protein